MGPGQHHPSGAGEQGRLRDLQLGCQDASTAGSLLPFRRRAHSLVRFQSAETLKQPLGLLPQLQLSKWVERAPEACGSTDILPKGTAWWVALSPSAPQP